MGKQVANVQLMQKMNRLKVLNYIRKNPNISRPTIAKDTQLSLASITNITSYLLDIGILSESGTEDVGRVGRKSTLLKFCEDSYNIVSIFLSENHMNIYVSNLVGKLIQKTKIPTDTLNSEEVIALAKEKVAEIISTTKKERILGIGVAVSGLVLENSRFIISSKLQRKFYDMKSVLENATGIPVFVDNISLLRAAMYFNVNSSYTEHNMLFIDLENGIGSAWYFNGQVNRATLGEIGHTTVEKNGEPCFCGNNGCLEAMCSVKRLFSLYESASKKMIDSVAELEKLYQNCDKSAEYAISECARYLGIGLANLVNLFNPAVIVINTGDFTECPSLLNLAKDELSKRAFTSLTKTLSVQNVTLSEDATIKGMAYNVCDRIFDIDCPDNIIE